MKIGSATLYGLLEKSALEVSEELYRNGIDVVEVMWEHKHNKISEKEASEMKKLGIDYSLHFPFYYMTFAYPDPERRKIQIGMVEKALKIAEKLEASPCVLHGGGLPDFYLHTDSPLRMEDFYEIFAKEFREIISRTKDSGIKIVIENLGARGQIGRYDDIIQIKEQLPDIGFCLDIPHARMNNELEKYIKNMRIDHVHVTDSRQGEDDHFSIGKGQLPIKEVMQKLKEKGYSGKVIFEGLTLKDTLESVKKLREMVK